MWGIRREVGEVSVVDAMFGFRFVRLALGS